MITKWILVYLAITAGSPTATTIEVFDTQQQCRQAMALTVKAWKSFESKHTVMFVCMPGDV